MNTVKGTIRPSMDERIRIGAVTYLNTKPLVCELRRLAPEADVVYDVPSRLADNLAAGELDVALIPSIEYLHDPAYTIVGNACIACRGPVLSVRMFSRVPPERIRTLALDEGSRTSIALVQILLDQQFGVRPELTPLSLGATLCDADTDAVLLIGDRAICAVEDGFEYVWDLGEEWYRWSDLPFVFAMWTAREGRDLRGVALALNKARDAGLSRLAQIATEQAATVGLSVNACMSYLRDNLHFRLGRRERRGLELFRDHAVRMGLAPPSCDLRFHDCTLVR